MNRRLLLAAAVVSLVLAGCGGENTSTVGDPRPSSSSAASQPSEAAHDGPAIEPGTYTRTVSTKDVTALGQDPAAFPDLLGANGKGLVAYKFEEGAWTEYHGPNEEQLERGSFGTLHYDQDGKLVLSEACCGDSLLTWQSDGSTLKMTLESSAIAVTPIDHLMRDGVYTKTS
jgi:hypothetical protein